MFHFEGFYFLKETKKGKPTWCEEQRKPTYVIYNKKKRKQTLVCIWVFLIWFKETVFVSLCLVCFFFNIAVCSPTDTHYLYMEGAHPFNLVCLYDYVFFLAYLYFQHYRPPPKKNTWHTLSFHGSRTSIWLEVCVYDYLFYLFASI